MKAVLALVILAVFIAVSDTFTIKAAARANLNQGYVSPGDRLLSRSYVYRPAIANSVRFEDVVFRGNITSRISAIQATEMGSTQWASVYVIGGGLGLSNVTIRFTSARGWGYYYLLDIWGR